MRKHYRHSNRPQTRVFLSGGAQLLAAATQLGFNAIKAGKISPLTQC